ncbi:MAG: LuxR C-terminal-related transcriptional regulator [Bacillota bacterium]
MPTPPLDLSAWIVAAKLHPPLLRSDSIRRPHLEESLCRAVSTLPLTLLSAPAGYGKTTLLTALPHLLPGYPLAWVTLDAEDQDPVRFAGLLVTALQRLNPDCGRSVWDWLSGGTATGAGLKQAMGALINEIVQHLPDPFLLVLDDLHTVTAPAVHVALEFLVEHQPPQMHLAISTRHDPPLRLARLAARRQLAELRRPDLEFRPEEAHQLLNETLGLSLSEAEVAALQQRTEGWPAGLCLLAGPLGRMGTPADRTQFMAALAHTERYALDFMADEVMRNLAEEQRQFLLQTSVLAEMTPSACRAVTGREDASEMLELLYRQNLTIASINSEVAGEPVYRHHALFARLLARQLACQPPGEVAELHRLAAAVQRTPGRAIHHYLSAGLWEEAAQMMDQHGTALLLRGMSETIRNWYSALPGGTQLGHPRLTVLVGRCEIHRGEYVAAGRLLEQARAGFRAAGDTAGEGEALTSLLTLAYRNNDRRAAAALVDRALELALNPMGQAAARLVRAWLRMSAEDCDWDACGADIREGLAVPAVTGDRRADMIGIPYMSAPLAAVPGCLTLTERYAAEAGERSLPGTAWRLGADELRIWPLIWRGRTEEALALAEAAEALRLRLGGYPFIGCDLVAQLAILRLSQGEREAAAQAAERLLKRLPGSGPSKWPFYLHVAGRTLALTGRPDEAQAVWQRLADLRDGAPLTEYLCDHMTGLLALLRGHEADAAAALQRAAGLEARLPIAWVGGSARLLQARLLLEQGRSEAARGIAAAVLSEWEQAGTPGCTALDGPAVAPVIRMGPKSGGDGLAEPLTRRECDVLRLIVAGRTNRQIGEDLYISEETVKSHVVHILRKLDASSRTQAAIRGRELGF